VKPFLTQVIPYPIANVDEPITTTQLNAVISANPIGLFILRSKASIR
jgi:hypothetical protein